MISDKQKKLIYSTVDTMLDKISSEVSLRKFIKKHNVKLHFVPKRYRIFGGMLQSLNIQFGNFIEELMTTFISANKDYEILNEYSGKKNNKFLLSDYNDTLIDNYISYCQTNNIKDLSKEFIKLQKSIIHNKNGKSKEFKHDIDLLFRDKRSDIIYYLEMKYNDDHDTGKFIDINRKFIKTYAYLVKEFNISKLNELIPVLFYFTNKKMKGNIYIPEETNIYRGKKFFEKFLDIKYDDLDEFLCGFSEDSETIKKFDKLYKGIMDLE